jgi:hypothetical protein
MGRTVKDMIAITDIMIIINYRETDDSYREQGANR